MNVLSLFIIMMPCLFLIIVINNYYRKTLVKKSITLIDAKVQALKIQEHKEHQHTEAVLEQNSQTLNLYRRVDGSFMLKMTLSLVISVVSIIACNIMAWKLNKTDYIVIVILSFVATIILPSTLRAMYVRKKVRKLTAELPWMIDLLAVSIQCGMTPEQAFKFLSTKMSGINPDFVPFCRDWSEEQR